MAAIGRADDAFACRDATEDPPWMGFYDSAQHAGDTGTALLDLCLARLADPREARSRHETAIHGRRPDLPRSRALSQIGLAKLTMARDDPGRSCQLGVRRLGCGRTDPVSSRTEDLADLGSSQTDTRTARMSGSARTTETRNAVLTPGPSCGMRHAAGRDEPDRSFDCRRSIDPQPTVDGAGRDVRGERARP